MGRAGWDDAPERGRSARDRRPPEAGRREGRDAPRAYDRSERGSGRGGRDEGARGSSSSWERPRPPAREDDWRSSSGGRSSRHDYDRGYNRPEQGRGRGGELDGGRGGDRSMRGPRPPREDAWEPSRSRSGAGGSGAGGSGGRYRAQPQGGGLWGDEDESPRGRRPGPGGSDPRARMNGSRAAMRDPRAMRRGLVPDDYEAETKKTGSFGAGKAFLIILVMFALGAGGALGYWKLSTPKIPANLIAPSDSGGTQKGASPSASPTGSPSATTAPTGQAPAILVWASGAA